MKVRNSRESWGGVVVYRMRRILETGERVGVDVAFSPVELECGRQHVAAKLRARRAELRRFVAAYVRPLL